MQADRAQTLHVKIRSATAEQLYLALQMYSILEDDEQVDHLLLETPWYIYSIRNFPPLVY